MNPATGFDPLPWHDRLWQRTWDAARSRQLGHALLLSGPAGVGKRPFAARLAAGLLCENPQPSGACGSCRSCIQRAAGTQPNLRWLRREFNDKTDKFKRDITLDQLRQMMEGLSLSSHYGGSRVVIIDPVDALNLAGVNALLKTLEEPPPGCHLLLITERRMALVPTLRSRCQHLAFAIPDSDVASRWLAGQGGGGDTARALDEAGGAPLAALADRESGATEQRQAWTRTLLDLAQRKVDPLAAASGVDKDAVTDWLRVLQRALLQILRCPADPGVDPAWRMLAARLAPLQIDRLLKESVEAQQRLQSNANPQLLVESLMILWWHLTSAPATPTRGTSHA